MSDQRRDHSDRDNRSHQKRGRGPPHSRDSDQDTARDNGRHPGRVRGRGQHSNRRSPSRDRRRSRSPGYRKQRGRDYDHPSRRDRSRGRDRLQDREERDGRRDDDHRSRGEIERVKPSRRRDRSPSETAEHQTLPTRARQDHKKPTSSMSFKVTSSRKTSEASPMHVPSQNRDGDGTLDRDDPRHVDDEEDEEEGEIDVDVVEDDGMAAMQAMMGFGGFGSTKGTKVVGNEIGGVRKEKKNEYRQYMNRQGGFNRPLSPSR